MMRIRIINKRNILAGLLLLLGVAYMFSNTLVYSNKISFYMNKQVIFDKIDSLRFVEADFLKSHINRALPIVDMVCNKNKASITEDKDLRWFARFITGFDIKSPKTILSSGFLLMNKYNAETVAALSITNERSDLNISMSKQNIDKEKLQKESSISSSEDIIIDSPEDNAEGNKNTFEVAKQYKSPDDIQVKNETSKVLDVSKLLKEKINIDIPNKGASVLIVHTHTCEAYTPTIKKNYSPSDPDRTENPEFNVVKVGAELKRNLEDAGIVVIHDTTMHDYPSYSGCYKRALDTIQSQLKKNPSIRFVFDIHRDAVTLKDGKKLRVYSKINNEIVAQPMLVVGTGESGLSHANWLENFKVALRIQYKFNKLYPGFARSIDLVQHRYNQHATTGSLIIEVGGNGNTLEEALNSSKYIAEAIAEVIKEIKD